jgi:hypothetical protein
MFGRIDRRALRVVALTLPAAAATALLSLPSDAVAAPPRGGTATSTAGAAGVPTVKLTPRFTTLPMKKVTTHRASARAAAESPKLQTFTRTFRYPSEHKTYSYTMVGYDPALTGTARIPNSITPVRLRFTGNKVQLPSPTTIKAVTRSALYTSQAFPGGKGPYGDVFMRTQFWSSIRYGKRNWHVVLAAPKVNQPLRLSVPSDKGGPARTSGGQGVWLVDINWFDSTLQSTILKQPATAVTQFVGADVVLCGRYDPSDLTSCGIGGYHSATDETAAGVRTYSYQSYLSSKIFGVKSGFYGLAPMSHELAAWLANPYVQNEAPAWTEPSNPQYGCSTELEVGDPLVGKVLVVAKQVYQDEAYLAFFARQKPSKAWLGRYSWFGTFKGYSRSC